MKKYCLRSNPRYFVHLQPHRKVGTPLAVRYVMLRLLMFGRTMIFDQRFLLLCSPAVGYLKEMGARFPTAVWRMQLPIQQSFGASFLAFSCCLPSLAELNFSLLAEAKV
jgi:hypothetical protein